MKPDLREVSGHAPTYRTGLTLPFRVGGEVNLSRASGAGLIEPLAA